MIDAVRPDEDLHAHVRATSTRTIAASITQPWSPLARYPGSLCYQAPSSTVDFRPTRFVSIDAFLDRKIEAIGAYGSQVEIRSYLDEELLRSTARYWARFANTRYVEPLEVVRDADLGGPVDQSAAPARMGVPADAR